MGGQKLEGVIILYKRLINEMNESLQDAERTLETLEVKEKVTGFQHPLYKKLFEAWEDALGFRSNLESLVNLLESPMGQLIYENPELSQEDVNEIIRQNFKT